MRRVQGVAVAVVAAVTSGCVVGGGAVVREEVVLEAEVGGGFEVVTEFVEVGPLAEPEVEWAEPPPFLVTTDLASIDVAPFSYCWEVDLAGPCVDSDADEGRFVAATRDRMVTVEFEPGTLTVASTTDGDRTFDVVEVDPNRWRLDLTDLEPGDYGVRLQWLGELGDALGLLTVRVMPAG